MTGRASWTRKPPVLPWLPKSGAFQLSPRVQDQLQQQAKTLTAVFQRSSSNVEGRNELHPAVSVRPSGLLHHVSSVNQRQFGVCGPFGHRAIIDRDLVNPEQRQNEGVTTGRNAPSTVSDDPVFMQSANSVELLLKLLGIQVGIRVRIQHMQKGHIHTGWNVAGASVTHRTPARMGAQGVE